ncbi:hypothetical protein HPP92_012576 [Vanilla planifolia]|uniref:Uncharacterized protein n=1 Tax=Vanilla planifolia TaxID=51239 RepID=A0A835R081_VANPL|nr:hypothetical protein HPP92_012576 [Vanilla planifolia]
MAEQPIESPKPQEGGEKKPVRDSWPELVGLTIDEALKILKEERPEAELVVVGKDEPVTLDYKFNRIRIFVDSDGKVARTPTIG